MGFWFNSEDGSMSCYPARFNLPEGMIGVWGQVQVLDDLVEEYQSVVAA